MYPLRAEISLKSMVVMFYCIRLVYYIIDMYLIMLFHLFMLQEGHVIKFPLQVKWTCGPDMPFGMDDYIQPVTIQETVYVGGGHAGLFDPKNYIVMTYNTRSCKWHQLPLYRAEGFAMVVINNQLVLVGSDDSNSHPTNLLSMWDTDSSQ